MTELRLKELQAEIARLEEIDKLKSEYIYKLLSEEEKITKIK